MLLLFEFQLAAAVPNCAYIHTHLLLNALVRPEEAFSKHLKGMLAESLCLHLSSGALLAGGIIQPFNTFRKQPPSQK